MFPPPGVIRLLESPKVVNIISAFYMYLVPDEIDTPALNRRGKIVALDNLANAKISFFPSASHQVLEEYLSHRVLLQQCRPPIIKQLCKSSKIKYKKNNLTI